MNNLLKAKDIIENKIPNLLAKSRELRASGLKPKLAVILVGNNPASKIYVKNKEKFCYRIEADFELIKLPEDISEKDFLAQVKIINNSEAITGCFVQLPVPKHLAHINITQLINPEKDVDGFHLSSVDQLYMGKTNGIIPCTPKGIVTLLQEKQIEISGSHIVVIGRSHIVGRPLTLLLQALDATVTMCHSKTKNIAQHTQMADIIISAVGIPQFIKLQHLNTEKNQVIIDVGMNKLDDKTVGDVHFSEVQPYASLITPVPGGVGPMTVYSLMENLLTTTKSLLEKKDTK